jgi:(1->4)-alpha-D-glucan 1-alpha-D-glucosylmutase
VQALFVDPAGEQTLTKLAGESRPWNVVAFEAKLEQALTTFRPEVEWLRRLYDAPNLELALASLPVSRTFVDPKSDRVELADREALAGLPAELQRVLLLDERGHDEFVTRFQQTTVGVAAKGIEDTAFYRYVRLLALNEVGGNPGRFSINGEQFHEANLARALFLPNSLLAGTTHDTKRSADVRTRIGLLSRDAERWAELVAHWHAANEPLRDGGAPDWSEELLIYQTLAGAWPLEPQRLDAYIVKALREAKRNTNWLEPNERWEESVQRFCRALFAHTPFRASFDPFVAELVATGERESLAQLALRLTSPGVPDIYQGDELTFLALVDPDNRRPVDWALRQTAIARRDSPKLELIRALLSLRGRRHESFAGAYEPLAAGEHTCAYRRGEDILVAVAVRGGEPEFDRPAGRWSDVVQVPGARVFERTT